MKRYTARDLSGLPAVAAEDMRLTITQNRSAFLLSAFKNNVLHSGKKLGDILLLIILVGVVALFFLGRPWKALALLAAFLWYYGKFFWAINKVYANLHDNDCFPVLTSEGPQYIMNIDDGERFIRVESAPWKEVECISLYDKFLIIEMKDESESGFFFMWSEDMEAAGRTALALWREALRERPENTGLPERYSETEMQEISDFIEDTFGNYDEVLHEVFSPDIHVDVAIIPPTKGRDYYTLCTIGAGAHRMNIPDELRYEHLLAERVELLIYLPADWPLGKDDLEDERNYWPIRLLKDYARMPINTDSWMAWGHSLSTDEGEPYAEGVPYSSAVLLCPQPDIEGIVSCPLSTGKSVDFFQVFPLTGEELEYKRQAAGTDEADSPTDAMLEHFQADRKHWMEYAMKRLDYRRGNR